MVTARTSQPGAVPAVAQTWTLAAAVLGFFVVTLDAVAVNVALPAIRRDLGGGITGLQWVVDGYTLAFAALLLSAGALTDRVGSRRAFGAGLVLFVLASAACGAAPTLAVLLTARFVQGAGAAAMLPASMALIHSAYPDPLRRARAVGTWAMGGSVAAAAGPLVGGVLTTVGWRTIFLVNLPVGAVALALLTRAPSSQRRRVPFDLAGQVSAVLAMTALTYAVIESGPEGPTAPRVLLAAAVAVLAIAVFVLVQARGRHPMLPLDLFAVRNIRLALLVGFTFMVCYYGMPFVVSLYLQQSRGLSPLATGLVFLPMLGIGPVLTPLSASVVERFGSRRVVVGGELLMASSMLGLALSLVLAPGTVPVWVLALLMLPVGLGAPGVMPPIMTVLLNSVTGARAGVASAAFNTSRQIGGALAVAVFGALLARPHGFVTGAWRSLLLAGALALLTAVAVRRLPPRAAPGLTAEG